MGPLGAHLPHDRVTPALAREIEGFGYGTLWLTLSPPQDLAVVEQVLDATEHLVVSTAVVNIWSTDPAAVAASFHRIEAAHPGRFVLGVGAGHPEVDAQYASPFGAMVTYLDRLLADGVPRDRIILAALGPRMLALTRDKAHGTVPALVTTDYLRHAREILGPDAVLAPSRMVVLDSDVDRARALGRSHVSKPAAHVSNYNANLRRIGFTDADLAEPGSDRLIDALVLHGDPAAVAAGIRHTLEVGASQVGIFALGEDQIGTLRTTAEAARAVLG